MIINLISFLKSLWCTPPPSTHTPSQLPPPAGSSKNQTKPLQTYPNQTKPNPKEWTRPNQIYLNHTKPTLVLTTQPKTNPTKTKTTFTWKPKSNQNPTPPPSCRIASTVNETVCENVPVEQCNLTPKEVEEKTFTHMNYQNHPPPLLPHHHHDHTEP